MNQWNGLGRITRDIELKYGQSGSSYVKFSLAVNRMKKGECDFINCTAFGKTAELIAEYVKKGDQLAVTGSISVEKVEDKTYTSINVFSITFVGAGSSEVKKIEKNIKKIKHVEDLDTDPDSFPF